MWQSRVVRPKADIKLTAGKAINVPIETLIDQVVKTNKVCDMCERRGGVNMVLCVFKGIMFIQTLIDQVVKTNKVCMVCDIRMFLGPGDCHARSQCEMHICV
jgi:hypothetical protein